MKILRRIFDSKGVPLLAGLFALLFLTEQVRALRKRRSSAIGQVITNSLVSVPSLLVLRFAFLPAMVRLADMGRRKQFGLRYQYKSTPLLKGLLTILVLDYGNYVWHILNHRVKFLWRFHLVHHCDPDLDVTTAVRFHFGEMLGSILFRGLVTFLSGATATEVILYEIIFEGATQFHHSNIDLPFSLEQLLNRVIVTPRMHGIHHSIIHHETDSNYAVIFSFWDRLHRTARLNIKQAKVITGVPSYFHPHEQTTAFLLGLPFGKIRSWGQPQIVPVSRMDSNNPFALAP